VGLVPWDLCVFSDLSKLGDQPKQGLRQSHEAFDVHSVKMFKTLLGRSEKKKHTISFTFKVASLGGSRIITERLMCTIGVPGIARNLTRSGWDCVAMTYRCLFLSPKCREGEGNEGAKRSRQSYLQYLASIHPRVWLRDDCTSFARSSSRDRRRIAVVCLADRAHECNTG